MSFKKETLRKNSLKYEQRSERNSDNGHITREGGT